MAIVNEYARQVLPGQIQNLERLQFGWKVDHDNDNWVTFIAITGGLGIGKADPYLLRLSYEFYPATPPSALFVHPETRKRGTLEEQKKFWPKVINNTSGPIPINVSTDNKVGGYYICFGYTYEFQITHNENQHIWKPDRHTVLATVAHIQQFLSGKYYGGYIEC